MSFPQAAPFEAPFTWPGFGPGMRGRRGRRAYLVMSETDETKNTESSRDGERERRRRHHGHRGRGPGFGPGPWGGRGPWGPPSGRRRERGDVRAAILLLLAEAPRHGYELITEISDRSDGQWQPSPGSIYPVLKRLAKDGLVTAEQADGKRVFHLTDAGRDLVAAEGASWGEPWQRADSPQAEAAMELWEEGKQLGAAVWQVGQQNDPDLIAAAKEVLADARKKIYGLLAQ